MLQYKLNTVTMLKSPSISLVRDPSFLNRAFIMKCFHASKIAVFYLFVLTTSSATFTGLLLKFGSVFILVEFEKHLMETKLTTYLTQPRQCSTKPNTSATEQYFIRIGQNFKLSLSEILKSKKSLIRNF